MQNFSNIPSAGLPPAHLRLRLLVLLQLLLLSLLGHGLVIFGLAEHNFGGRWLVLHERGLVGDLIVHRVLGEEGQLQTAQRGGPENRENLDFKENFRFKIELIVFGSELDRFYV